MLGSAIASALIGLGVLTASASAQEPWGFEQVTPVEKGAGTVSYVDTFRTSEDGDSLLYTANSGFESVPPESILFYVRYHALRGSDGWTNRPTDPPIDKFFTGNFAFMGTFASSKDLAYVLVTSPNALTPGAIHGGSNLYLRETATGELTLMAAIDDPALTSGALAGGEASGFKYVSSQGDEVIFNSNLALTPDASEWGPTVGHNLYRWTAEEGLEAISVLPEAQGGDVIPGSFPTGGDTVARNAFIPDGNPERVYFDTPNRSEFPPHSVYVRAEDQTRPIARSHIEGDSLDPVRANLDAVSGDTNSAVFHTFRNTRLTEDTPTIVGASAAPFIYRYQYDTDELTYIGHGLTQAQTTVHQMSDDTETVVFNSNAALTPDGVPDANNLYVWHEGVTSLITTGAPVGIRVLSENGRYYAFSASSSALASEFGVGNISDNCRTAAGTAGPCSLVYVYDVQEGELSCASCPADGADPRYEAGDPSSKNSSTIRMDSYQRQFVANDGTVFFATADPLVSNDVNGALDVYAYRDGEHRLITKATQGTKYARFIDATADGKKVFIATDDRLAPTDTDKSVDIYRTGPDSGFAYDPPDITPPCQGAECRGPSSPLPVLTPTGSVDFQGAGNPDRAGKVEVHRAGKLRGSKIRLRISVPTAGKIAIGGRKVRNKRKSVNSAGSYRISTRLTRRTRKRLTRKRQMNVPVRVRFKPQEGSASSLKFAVAMKANSKRKGR